MTRALLASYMRVLHAKWLPLASVCWCAWDACRNAPALHPHANHFPAMSVRGLTEARELLHDCRQFHDMLVKKETDQVLAVWGQHHALTRLRMRTQQWRNDAEELVASMSSVHTLHEACALLRTLDGMMPEHADSEALITVKSNVSASGCLRDCGKIHVRL